jgi:kynureninase
MFELRSRSLLLTAYAEFLLNQITDRSSREQEPPFNVITPSNPMERGAQLSVLIREDLMDGVSKALENAGIICDKRKPGCIRVAPVPLYNTFGDVWRFMETLETALHPSSTKSKSEVGRVDQRLRFCRYINGSMSLAAIIQFTFHSYKPLW